MITTMTKKETISFFIVCILAIFCSTFLGLCTTESAAQEGTKYHAVIIRAAGYLPGTEKPDGKDAITHATSEPGNTYFFSDTLFEELSAKGIETKVIDYSQCQNLSCLTYLDTEGNHRVIDILIFAGPSYGRKLPQQLLNLIPKLNEIVKDHPNIICSSLISANYTYRGIVTMMGFDEILKQADARTITGVVFNSDVIQKELDEDIKDFADSLIAEVKK